MPLDKRMSHAAMMREMLKSYKATGKLGNTRPKTMKQAARIANAIAYRMKRGR